MVIEKETLEKLSSISEDNVENLDVNAIKELAKGYQEKESQAQGLTSALQKDREELKIVKKQLEALSKEQKPESGGSEEEKQANKKNQETHEELVKRLLKEQKEAEEKAAKQKADEEFFANNPRLNKEEVMDIVNKHNFTAKEAVEFLAAKDGVNVSTMIWAPEEAPKKDEALERAANIAGISIEEAKKLRKPRN